LNSYHNLRIPLAQCDIYALFNYYVNCVGQVGTEKYILQIHNNKNSKTVIIDASNIMSVESLDKELLITIILPNNKEMNFRAESPQLFTHWLSSLKVAIGKGKLFVCVCVCACVRAWLKCSGFDAWYVSKAKKLRLPNWLNGNFSHIVIWKN